MIRCKTTLRGVYLTIGNKSAIEHDGGHSSDHSSATQDSLQYGVTENGIHICMLSVFQNRVDI